MSSNTSNDNSNAILQEEEDVVLEGSALHQALTSLGYNNFDYIPRYRAECSTIESDSQNPETYESNWYQNRSSIWQYFFQDDKLKMRYLEIIANSSVLLDDHALAIQGFFRDPSPSVYKSIIEWFPYIGSTVAVTASSFFESRTSICIAVMASTICCMFSYKEVKTWMSIKTLKNFITAQNDLHHLVKQCLKILRRVYRKRSNPLFLQEKNSLLGNRKLNIVTAMKQALIEIFENLSSIYYEQAQDIYEFLPDKLQLNCILTKIEFESDKDSNERNYEDLKSLYYTFILVQSELLFIIANTYNAKEMNTYGVPNNKLLQVIKSLTNLLDIYHTKLTKLYIEYQKTEVKPVKRVFRGLPNSKWQDTYVHLDLTSQRIQSAFKEITSILEYIDTYAEYDEDNMQLAEFVTDKMNEAYKMIEHAKNFAEFTSLLIAKAQKKAVKDVEKEENNENLFPIENDNRRVVVIDDYPEIQDEVFEEYIREEYIRPLIESSEGIMESFKLDKLLKKNFMSELKEVLIEKQRTMKERELKALKRMYNKVRRDSCTPKMEPETTNIGENLANFVPKLPGTTSTPTLKDLTIVETENDEKFESKVFSTPSPLAPLPPPLPSSEDSASFESHSDEIREEKKSRKPVPLPRVKMLNTNDEIEPLQRFSIAQITPNFKLPASFKIAEETFVGSGENSDEEYVKSDSEDDAVEN